MYKRKYNLIDMASLRIIIAERIYFVEKKINADCFYTKNRMTSTRVVPLSSSICQKVFTHRGWGHLDSGRWGGVGSFN